jgi:carbonic anhydrase/acetyltransferase-like protein (isoleucine patch superfamily)
LIGDVSLGRDCSNGSPLVIGSYVTVGHSAILHGCTIGDERLIGMGSLIMDDVIIGDRVMVGAGSLVSPGKILESGYLLCRPARRAGTGTQCRRTGVPEILGRTLCARQEQQHRRDAQ